MPHGTSDKYLYYSMTDRIIDFLTVFFQQKANELAIMGVSLVSF